MTNKARDNQFSSSLANVYAILTGGRNRRNLLAAAINLFGLRVVTVAGTHPHQKGVKSKIADRWRRLKRSPKDVGLEINEALDELSHLLNIPALSHHPDYLTLEEEALYQAIARLDRLTIDSQGPSNLIEASNAIDIYTSFAALLKIDPEGITPSTVNRLIATLLLSPDKEVTSVYDPTCGFGGSLSAMHSVLRSQGREKGVRFYGQDINPEAISVATWRLLLNGVIDFHLEVGDTLLEPRFHDEGELERFDVVLSVPPLYPTAARDLDKNDPFQRFRYGAVGGGRAEYAFVQHVLASTAPGGRAAIVLALSALGRSGYEEEIRSRIVHADLLETVINLPTNALSVDNHIFVTSVLLFDLAKPDMLEDTVLFINGDYYVKNLNLMDLKVKAPLTPEIADQIMQIYRSKSEQVELSASASLEDVRARDYSLMPVRYIPQKPPPLPTTDEVKARISELNEDLEKTLKALEDAYSSIEKLR